MDIHEFYLDRFDQLLREALEAATAQARSEQRTTDDREIADLKAKIQELEEEVKWLEERW